MAVAGDQVGKLNDNVESFVITLLNETLESSWPTAQGDEALVTQPNVDDKHKAHAVVRPSFTPSFGSEPWVFATTTVSDEKFSDVYTTSVRSVTAEGSALNVHRVGKEPGGIELGHNAGIQWIAIRHHTSIKAGVFTITIDRTYSVEHAMRASCRLGPFSAVELAQTPLSSSRAVAALCQRSKAHFAEECEFCVSGQFHLGTSRKNQLSGKVYFDKVASLAQRTRSFRKNCKAERQPWLVHL
jgi:hypothetical protein